jgi:hypothetical protein
VKRLLPLLLAACVSEPAPVVPDARALNVTIEAWDESGRAFPATCAERPEIRALDDVMAVCGEDSAGIVVGCFLLPDLIIVTTDKNVRADTVVHEALHWLSWCAYGDGDSRHADPDVWGYGGVYGEALTRLVP